MSNLNVPAQQWLDELFQDSYCDDCGGDAQHHTAIPLLGNWFARCDFPPNEDGVRHPMIQEYRHAQ